MVLLGESLLLPIEDQVSSCLSSWSLLILISLCCVLGLRHSFRSCALPLFLLLHNEYSGLVTFRIGWLDPLAVQGTLKHLLQHHSSKASVLRRSTFFMVQLAHPYMTTGKAIVLTLRAFVGKVTSLLCNSEVLSIG